MALILREARMASLSAKVGSSFEGTLAERMTHISQRLTLTARRSARLRGEPCKEKGRSRKFIFRVIYNVPVAFGKKYNSVNFGIHRSHTFALWHIVLM